MAFGMQRLESCAGDWRHRAFSRCTSPARLAFLLVFGLFLLPVCAFAHNFRVSGTVSDPTQKPVAGASVELVDLSGSVRVRAMTDSMGTFQFTADSVMARTRTDRKSTRLNSSHLG